MSFLKKLLGIKTYTLVVHLRDGKKVRVPGVLDHLITTETINGETVVSRFAARFHPSATNKPVFTNPRDIRYVTMV